jgi:hypothetical protein
MADPTPAGKELFRVLSELAHGQPRVEGFEVNGVDVDILIANNTPERGVRMLATLSLSAKPAVRNGAEQDYGVELVTFHYDRFERATLPLADAGYYAFANRDELLPGGVLPGLLEPHGVSSTLKHFFLTVPEEFDGKLKSIKTSHREVRYLEATPIADEEMSVVGVDGAEALAEIFDEKKIDRFDWDRASAVDP